MGIVVEARKLHSTADMFRLLIYTNILQDSSACSINKPMAEELLKLKANRRTMQFDKCFSRVLNSLPANPTIKDIDVMFNPAYEVDVLKVLVSAYKQKPFSLIWPGKYEDGKLIYSAEGFPDYKVYDINDYDIVCVI